MTQCILTRWLLVVQREYPSGLMTLLTTIMQAATSSTSVTANVRRSDNPTGTMTVTTSSTSVNANVTTSAEPTTIMQTVISSTTLYDK